MSSVHLAVQFGAARRRGKLHIDRETGAVRLWIAGERRGGFTGHISELAECLYEMRCRELAREALAQRALKRRRSA